MAQVYRIHADRGKRRQSIFGNFSVTAVLILINVVLFVLFSLLISLEIINISFIAIKPSNIVQGKYLWTFITSMFMHGGFIHLFVNMFSLFFVGSLVQRILGAKRYLYFYLLAGLFAGLIFVLGSLIYASDFNAFAVGASGALFGLVGLLVLLTPNLPVFVMFIPIPIKMKYAGPGLLIVLWLISSLANIPVGNTAHFGGLIAGLIYGIYLKSKYKRKTAYISRHFS